MVSFRVPPNFEFLLCHGFFYPSKKDLGGIFSEDFDRVVKADQEIILQADFVLRFSKMSRDSVIMMVVF